jgi:hypothetical protein
VVEQRRAHHGQRDVDPRAERRSEVERIGPDPADAVGRHQDLRTRGRGRRPAAGREATGDRRIRGAITSG